jgi:hypothetical protein
VALGQFGYPENWMSIATTEKLSASDLDDYVKVISNILKE